jgi:hypothetical protein
MVCRPGAQYFEPRIEVLRYRVWDFDLRFGARDFGV